MSVEVELETLNLDVANEELANLDATGRLRWAVDRFGSSVALLSSMQRTSSVLMHLFHVLDLQNEILFVDTGFHFHETLRLRDEYLLRYRLNLVTLYPTMTPTQQENVHGRKLHLDVVGQPECCRMRKEEPFLGHMRARGHRVVVNGVRRADGKKRANARFLIEDPRIKGYALHPILDWSEEQLAGYLVEHGPPVHPLHAQGYPSIGCQPCTTPVAPGEDERAGRWRHLREADQGPLYCGINFGDGSGI